MAVNVPAISHGSNVASTSSNFFIVDSGCGGITNESFAVLMSTLNVEVAQSNIGSQCVCWSDTRESGSEE